MTAAAYRMAVHDALADGWRFGGLHAVADGSSVRVLLVLGTGATRLESVATEQGAVPTIVDLAPAAAWDEREAHDLYGVAFTGHEPLRSLVDHDPDLARWTVPVRGHDAYQVAVGPIHAGVIESGHFRFHVVGERILHLDARLFYKHRGLERAAEGSTPIDGLAFASRACAACAVSNGVAYAQACEALRGLTAGAELARARTVLLELERVWSHLNDISAVCSGVGLAAGTMRFAGFTEQARRLNALVGGHRFLFGTVVVGGSALVVPAGLAGRARAELAALRTEAATAWRDLAFNVSFQDRLPDIGLLTADDARRLGATGPAARAAGVAEDARETSPNLAYGGFSAVVPERPAGDVQARVDQRMLELDQSLAMLDDLLAGPISPSGADPGAEPAAIGVGRVESPRGATTCVVEVEDGSLRRLRLRTGSYANWPVLAHAAAGNLLPDFPLINKSFELCYACADR